MNLTENEEYIIMNTVITIEGAGVREVDGEYTFVSIKHNAGYYRKEGIWDNKKVNFTLYKCSVQNSGFQWFLSVTPDSHEPGTKFDLDFYNAIIHAKNNFDILPPILGWSVLNNSQFSRLPLPQIKLQTPVIPDLSAYVVPKESLLPLPTDSDSDFEDIDSRPDDSSYQGQDGGSEIIDDFSTPGNSPAHSNTRYSNGNSQNHMY